MHRARRSKIPVSINRETIIKLRGACSQRKSLATELFQTDFSGAPECFVKNGKAFHSTKSQILQCIVPVGKPVDADNPPDVQLVEQSGEQSSEQSGEQYGEQSREQLEELPVEKPDESFMTYIVDISVEVRARATVLNGHGYTFREFVIFALNSIASKAREHDAKQIDLVIDFYHKLSIKSGTRTERGVASRVLFGFDGHLPRNYQNC